MSVKIRDLMILSSRNLPGCEMVRMGSAVVHCEGFELELVYAELDHRRTTQSEKKSKEKRCQHFFSQLLARRQSTLRESIS